jgi:AcrR family transcriptional regulator
VVVDIPSSERGLARRWRPVDENHSRHAPILPDCGRRVPSGSADRARHPDVSPTASYDNERRAAQSQETKQRILEAARQQLTAKGYRAMTIAQVARTAGVHHDTIYALVGRKPEILRELIEMAISGTDGPVAPEEREYVQRMLAEPDPRQKLAIYASAMRAIQTRMAPLLLALRDASVTEPEAEEVWDAISERRAINMRRLVVALGEGVLRPGLAVDTAADVIWATASSEVFLLLTTERHWSLGQYEQWLADSWCRLLLDA